MTLPSREKFPLDKIGDSRISYRTPLSSGSDVESHRPASRSPLDKLDPPLPIDARQRSNPTPGQSRAEADISSAVNRQLLHPEDAAYLVGRLYSVHPKEPKTAVSRVEPEVIQKFLSSVDRLASPGRSPLEIQQIARSSLQEGGLALLPKIEAAGHFSKSSAEILRLASSWFTPNSPGSSLPQIVPGSSTAPLSNMKQIFQAGGTWSQTSWGEGTIATSGCCPTTAAMILNSLGITMQGGKKIDPDVVVKWAKSERMFGGTPELIKNLGKGFPVKVEPLGNVHGSVKEGYKLVERAKRALDQGKPVALGAVGPGISSSRDGHYIVLVGYSETEKSFIVRDTRTPKGGEMKRISFQTVASHSPVAFAVSLRNQDNRLDRLNN